MAVSRRLNFRRMALLAGVPMCFAGPAPGQQPDLPRTVLPLPAQPFGGMIAPTIADARPEMPRRLSAPAGAPNVVLVMTDDVGFAASSAFGGPIPTPNLERLARVGLRYNRFTTTAICSPSRAALLTGRNSHQVGTGFLADGPTGFPGYDAAWPQSAAPIARILQLNGYNTAMFGKHHNLPSTDQSAAGPFDQWPTGLGFDYFYGFVGGDVHQMMPKLYRGITPVADEERAGEPLDQRLIDDALVWIHNQKAAAPDKPFMIYLAPGTMHAPQQAPADWIARFRGKFDQGWDRVREESFGRQLASGIVPKGTKLTPRPSQIPAWSSLSPDDRRYAARMMEVAAGALAFQDAQFGRLLDELARMGQIDNTLVIFIEGDNGASGEAGYDGVTNEFGDLMNGVRDGASWRASQIDQLGGTATYENYPIGWAWAMDTPFRWTKQFASHLGGIRNGMVISWPKRITDGGAIRAQYAHLIDIAPTILEAAGLPAPTRVYGVEQSAYPGMSLTTTFKPGAAQVPRTQYYEIAGTVGIYSNGWFAGRWTGRLPWEFDPPQQDRPWELYNLDIDFSQSRDLAATNPRKLADMKVIFDREAKKYNVYPLDAGFATGRGGGSRPRMAPSRREFDYWATDTSVAQGAAPQLSGRSFEINADVDLPAGASGVLVATGSMFGGWSFFLADGRPVAHQAFSQKAEDQFRVEAAQPLGAGRHTIRFVFIPQESKPGSGGRMKIYDGITLIGEGDLARTIRMTAGIGETFDIGRDTGVPVAEYANPQGRLNGTLSHVRVLFP